MKTKNRYEIVATMLCVVSLFLISCGGGYVADEGKMMYDMASVSSTEYREQVSDEPMPENEMPEAEAEVNKKKIIKQGSMSVTVDDLQSSKSYVDSLLQVYNGYYANEYLSNNDYSSSYNLKIRIVAQHYDSFIYALEHGGGVITLKNIQARDVTEQFVDIQTRLANKRNYLERYNELLKKAETIKEILEIEEIIRNLEEEIESAEGRLRHLSDQVAYSTLDLRLTSEKEWEYKPEKRKGFGEEFKKSLSKGWYGFVDFLLVLLRLWPLWLIVFVALFIWRKRRNRKKNKATNK